MITAHEVYDAEFRRAAIGTVGYDEVAVDDFLDRVIATLNAIEREEALPQSPVTSDEVVNVEFPERGTAVQGGYDLDDVDDLLDEVAKQLFAFEQGRELPHAQTLGGAPAAPEVSDGGASDVGASDVDASGVADAHALAVAAGAPAIAAHDPALAQREGQGEHADAERPGAAEPSAVDALPLADERGGHEGAAVTEAPAVNMVGAQPLPEEPAPTVASPDTPIHPVGFDPDDESVSEAGAQTESQVEAVSVPPAEVPARQEQEQEQPEAQADAPSQPEILTDAAPEVDAEADAETRPQADAPSQAERAVPSSAASVIVDDVARGGDLALAPRRTMGESWGDGVGAELPLPGVAPHAEAVPAGENVERAGVQEGATGDGFAASAHVTQSDWAPSEASPDASQIVSFPATDHRVPLPRGEIRRAMTDDDLEAESHYHPEYSAYATPEQPDASSGQAASADEVSSAAVVPSSAQADVVGALDAPTVSLPDLDPLEPTVTPDLIEEHVVAHDDIPAESGADAMPGRVAPANEEMAGVRPPRDPETIGNPPPAVAAELARQAASRDAERQDAQLADEPRAPEASHSVHAASGIGRPEPIDAPSSLDEMTEVESIDAPAPLPPRDDTSRKGILRRFFKS